jgi:Flp pilus assembly protein TadB
MDLPPNNVIQFLARFGGVFVLSGLWLAYVGDHAWWLGGAVGFVLAALLGLAISLDRHRRRRRHRDRLDELLSKL